MLEAVATVLSICVDVSQCLFAPVRGQLSYLWNYKSNFESLKQEVKNLTEARERLRHRVDDAKRRGEAIELDVQTWLTSVNEIIDDAGTVTGDEAQAQSYCLKGLCPNLKTRYQISKNAVRNVKAIAELQEKGRFEEVSYRTVPQETWIPASKGYESFESRRTTLKDIQKALSDPKVNMVGVYGMGGIGKTTLVKDIAMQAEKDKLFYEVVFAHVSQTPDIKVIQGEIADKLGLEFHEETESGRARKLRERLSGEKKILSDNIPTDTDIQTTLLEDGSKESNELLTESSLEDGDKESKGLLTERSLDTLSSKMETESGEKRTQELSGEKKILVILDNVWTDLDLDTIGIPLGEDNMGCKVLFTARNLDVLTNMNCDNNFQVRILDEEESWSLFKKMAGEGVENHDLKPIASGVAKECGGLPIAIVTIAKALRGKEIYQWRSALQELKNPSERSLSTGVQAKAYSSIELSFKYLEDDELRSAFLLCSLMADTDCMLDLLKYSIGWGLFRGIKVMEEARDKMYTLLDKLKTSCLLLDGQNSESFSMHDVVRDVALTIASRYQHVFSVRDETVLIRWPNKDVLQNCTAITLLRCNVSELPEGLKCPKLTFLYIRNPVSSVKIPQNFFKGMTKLKVLHLTGLQLLSLPSSIRLLRNLRTLCLDHCELRDIAIIGELKELEILSFVSSNIEQLPKEIGQLICLKLLDLSNCNKLKIIAPNVISSLSELEELYMCNTFIQWGDEGTAAEERNASLRELKYLSHLTSLEIHIEDANILPKGLFSKNLERYRIYTGHQQNLPYSESYKCTRMLKLNLNTNISMKEIMQLKGIEVLYLEEVHGIKNVIHEVDTKGFLHLKHLIVQNNSSLLCIVDSMERVPHEAFPQLETILLSNLINLEKICHGPLTAESFCKLNSITVDNCGKLKNIFSFSIVKSLQRLQTVNVIKCDALQEIFTSRREDNVNNNEVIGMIELGQLRTLTLKSLPYLTSFYSKVKIASMSQERVPMNNEVLLEDQHDTPTTLFNDMVLLPNLEGLEVHAINCEKIWQPSAKSSCFQNLTRLILQECGNLDFLFSSYMVRSFLKLQHLEIYECPALQEIVAVEELGEEERMNKVFPQLNILKMENLENLTRFCLEDYIEFPSLKKLQIKQCPKFEAFLLENESRGLIVGEEVGKMSLIDNQPFFNEKVAFHDLEEMVISDLDYLKIIWHSNKLAQNTFGKLKSIKVEGCDKLQTLFSSSALEIVTRLESLSVKNCQSLKNIFPASIARCLLQLEVLEIIDCRILEEIVAKEGKGEPSTVRFVFPKVTHLVLRDLPELTTFYPEVHTSEWPVLENLEMSTCPKVKVFASEVPDFRKTSDEDQLDISIQQPFFSVQKIFPRLEVLKLRNNIMMIFHSQFPRHLFSKLTTLIIQPVFQIGFLERFYNLEMLTLDNSSCKELFSYEEVENHAGNFVQLKSLHLESLYALKHIWKQDPKVNLILQNLEILSVKYCGNLVKLLPSSSSFQNLTTLQVYFCKEMINLATSSTAKSLGQLREMQIEKCEKITEIVANEGDITEVEVVFSKLEKLSLVDVNSLTRFCSANYTCKFPALEELTVSGCPKLKIFSEGGLSTSKLWRVWLDGEQYFLEVDLNRTIQQCHNKMVLDVSAIEFEKIRQSQCAARSSHFQNLKRLVVQGCGRLKYLFPPSIVKSFLQLQHLEIYKCPVLNEIIAMEELKDIKFPRLNFLRIEELENLTRFCLENYVEFPSLKKLEIKQCPKFKAFVAENLNRDLTYAKVGKMSPVEVNPFFNEKVALPDLEDMVISHLDDLKMIWHNSKLAHNSFSKLKSIRVEGCDKLLTLFPSKMLGRLSKLWSLIVYECGSLEEIFGVQVSNFEESYSIPVFRLWRSISVTKCQSLKSIFPASIAKGLLQLMYLQIMDCGILEDIVSEEGGDSSTVKFVFPKVKSIRVTGCDKLQTLFSSNVLGRFTRLESLSVKRCQSLKNIFPVSVARSLLKLTDLMIGGCEVLEEIVTKERGKPGIVPFVFPKVTRLVLRDLPKLTTFYLGLHTTEWPILENLECDCENVKVIAPISPEFQKTNDEGQLDISSQQSLIFSVQKIFPRLKVLELRKNIMMICHSRFPRHLFSKLTTLRITEKEAAVFPLALFEIFHNLNTLELFNSSYKELISYEELEKNSWNFSRIKSLHLESLLNLKHMWKQDSRINPILGNLESLSVKYCANLVELVPSPSCFQNLTTLEVYHCRGMINLVTSTTAKSLEQLQVMRIERCGSIIEVVANEGELAEDEIVFTKLEKLSLVGLESLTSFCSALYTFEFPALEVLTVSNCPKMNIFCKGALSASKLQRAWLNSEQYFLEGDLNRTIQQTVLEVSVIDFEKTWQSEFPEMSPPFQNLRRLVVQGCGNSNYLFTSSMAKSLSQLQHLEICNCPVLEEIIATDELRNDVEKEIMFPQLKFLKVDDLENLTRFCTKMCIEFSSLKQMHIKCCPKFKAFVLESMSRNISDGEVVKLSSIEIQPFFNEKVVLPDLEEIVVSHLDDLKMVWHNNKLANNSFCELKSIEVEGCDKLLTLFPSHMLGTLLRLESLTINDCSSLEEIFGLQGSNIEETHSMSVFCLQRMSVTRCQILKNIFPVSMARILSQLKSLKIIDCGILEEIVAKEGGGEPSTVKFVFPEVTSLVLRNLPALTTFYPEVYSSEWPVLKELVVYGCKRVQVFPLEILDFEKTNDERNLDIPAQQPMFFVEKLCPNLEILRLSSQEITKIWHGQYPRDLFTKLKHLGIQDDESTVFPLGLLEKFCNLERLMLLRGSYKELFSYGDVEKHAGSLAQIKQLFLRSLRHMKCMWKLDSKMNSILQNLETLCVEYCDILIILVRPSASFQNLTTLKVCYCKGMLNLVTSSTAKSLERLREMSIEGCRGMTEIVSDEGDVAEDEIVFNKLEELSLVRLESLISLCSANHTFSFPLLDAFIVRDCPKMKIFCEGALSTPKLEMVCQNREDWRLGTGSWEGDLNKTIQQVHKKEVLEVSAIDFEMIWQRQFPEMSSPFQNLRRLVVQGCGNSNYLFTSSIAKSFLQLQHLEICKCPVLEEIIATDELRKDVEKEIMFPQLKFLKVDDLENLTRFCTGMYIEFSSLKQMHMKCCPKFKAVVLESMNRDISDGEIVKMGWMEIQPFFNEKVVLPDLEEMVISHLDDLKMIWHNSKLANNSFGELKSIKVEGCDKLLTLFPPNMLGSFVRLESLTVNGCSSLEEIFGLQGSNFEETHSMSLFHLRRMSVTKCQSLKNIFPFCMAGILSQLRRLEIIDCGILEEIVAKDAGGEPSTVNFVFPKVASFVLKNLPALTTFYPGVHSSEWPMLKELVVYGCERAQVFPLEILDFEKTSDERNLDIPAQQPMFLVEKICPNLETLSLSCLEITKIWQGQFPRDLFTKLKRLRIKDDESTVFPLGVLEKFCNLETLTLLHGSYKEIFSYGDVEKHVGNLAQIKKLSLLNLSEMKYMWKQDFKMNSILQNLDSLVVKNCDNLITLLPPSASFENLTTLKVHKCKGMINLVTSSTAKSLEQLREMSIEGCRGMTKIVSDEGDVAEDEIVFNKLEELSLVGLESLTSFCSTNYTFIFPSLDVLVVRDCPKMKIFCEGALHTPKLKLVRQNREDRRVDLGFFENGLNTTIQLLHKKKGLEVSAIDFEKIWQSQFPTTSSHFQNLEHLVVQGYGNLSYLFTSSIARSFVQLKHLEICKCPVLEEIIVMEEIREDVQQNIMFPQLKFLKLEDLQSITKFCTEMYIEFSSLEQLHVEHCPKFKAFVLEIMSRDLTVGEEVVKLRSTELETFFNHKAAFPNLEEMVISHLDDLKMIWHNNKLVHNTFCKLKSITVEGCDKLLTLFPSNMLGRLSRVESVTVNECGSLEAIFGFQGSRFEERLLMPIFKLKQVSVSKCHSLKNVFLLSIARSLLELFELKLIDCGKLEEIVAMEGGGEPSNTKFVFPQVAFLVLKNLPALTNFYPGVHTSEWPVLKELLVYGCDKVKVFDSEFLNYRKTDDEGQLDIPTQQPFFLVEKIIPNLKTLRLSTQDIMMIWQGMFPGHLFSKLKALGIKDEKSAVFPLGLLEKFCNVDELTLSHGSYKELFSYEEVEKHIGSLARIKKLLLENLSELKYIWRQDSKMNLILQNLESLKVEYCDIMINLVPASSSFQNLMTLEVCYCKGMVNLITSSTAKSLKQLREMNIEGCKGMTEIVADDGDVAEDEIVFNKLEELSLVGLESLASFCSANHAFNFPSLEILIVRDCPKMNIFCEGTLSTSMLKTVCQNREEYWKFDIRCWEGDLNTTIQQLHNKMNVRSSIEDSGQPSVHYLE